MDPATHLGPQGRWVPTRVLEMCQLYHLKLPSLEVNKLTPGGVTDPPTHGHQSLPPQSRLHWERTVS